MCLFPISVLGKIRPVAAADYFLRTPFGSWFFRRVVRINPIDRTGGKEGNRDLLGPVVEALQREEIVIFFPEGTRGEPERLAEFKKGVGKLASRSPETPMVPIYLHGLGKALPRGESVLVPFFCDVFVGQGVRWSTAPDHFNEELRARLVALAEEGHLPAWE
jgi:1-acyl-sn-glycerol-3-phosphate acyltransferase